jgi:hypothetical protein
MKAPHTNVLVRMSPDLKDELETYAKANQRSLTKEINDRLQVSLGAHGPTLQTILAREEAARTAPGIAPSAPNTPHTTGPQGQAVHLSEHDMAMLRVFHAMPVEKQLALLSLFK